ncbi:MAG: GDP-mannose 4,6-dehydratase, partial [Myxococcota bacterium]
MRRLADAGHQTFGADREVDITKPSVIEGALQRFSPDAVIHLAAMSSVAQSFREPEHCYQLNFLGTRNLLTAARLHCPKARVLLIGSADQYAATTGTASAIDESMPLRPRSPYARTKTAAEMLAEEALRKGLDVIRIRAFNHTG